MASVQAAEVRQVTLDFENNIAAKLEGGVTTTTFYRGEARAAAAFIRERLRTIITANPWMLSRVVRDKQAKNVQLVYPCGIVTDALLDEVLRIDPPGLKIDSQMSYIDLCNAVSASKEPAQLPQMRMVVNKPDRATRVTLVSDPTDQSAFAMVFSISHCAGDGYTYFSILNMLSDGAQIKALNPVRKQDKSQLIADAIKEDMSWFFGCTFMMGIMCKLICGPKINYHARLVDPAKINAAKEDAVKRGAKFVSTNDILTSTFGNMTSARNLMMAVNFRNRVDGLIDSDAGNYDGVPVLDEDVYKNPEGIRNVLAQLQQGAPLKSRTRGLPGFFEVLRSSFSVVTNWASFAADGVMLPKCEQILQLPMVDLTIMPTNAAIIFVPRPKELAVLYAVANIDQATLCQQVPVGAKASETLF